MDKTSELDCFLYYMWNAWDCWENDKVFGECASEAVEDPNNPGQMVVGSDLNPANHFWNKWCYLNRKYHARAPAVFYSELSAKNRRKIVDAAIKHYNK